MGLGKLLLLIFLCIGILLALTMGVKAGVAAFLYGLFALLASLLGLIPFGGPWLYCHAMESWVGPFVASFVTLGTWSSLIFSIGLILSIILCIVTTIIAIILIVGGILVLLGMRTSARPEILRFHR